MDVKNIIIAIRMKLEVNAKRRKERADNLRLLKTMNNTLSIWHQRFGPDRRSL